MKNLNIGIGKIGKSIIFDKKKWGIIGGDYEAPGLINILSKMNKNVNFYILSKSDYGRIDDSFRKKINSNGNIYNVWETYNRSSVTDWPLTYFKNNNIKLDFCIILSGPCGQSTIPNYMYTIKNDRIAKPMFMMENYAGPLIKLLNNTNVPFIEMGEDFRYFPIAARDLINNPKYILCTQELEKIKKRHIIEPLNKSLIETEIEVHGSQIDKIFLSNEEKRTVSPYNRNIELSVYSNGLTDSGGINKLPILEEYCFKYFKNCMVYGEWPEESLINCEYKNNFKEIKLKDHSEDGTLDNTKYSLMIGIKNNNISSKFWKLIYHGIIPFIYENVDCNRIQSNIDFIRISSPEDLKNKIDFLNNNEDEYIKLFNLLQSLIDNEDYYNGKFVNNLIFNEISKNIDISNYTIGNGELDFKMSFFKNNIEPVNTLF